MYLDVTVCGRRLSVLLDSGCETSVIGESLLPGIRLESSTQELYAANGTRIPIVGETDLEIRVGDVKIPTRIVVSRAISEMILGIDFLTQNRCRWDFGRSLIELGGKWVRLRGRPDGRQCDVFTHRRTYPFLQGTWPMFQYRSSGQVYVLQPKMSRWSRKRFVQES